MMDAGALDRRITFQSRTGTQDSATGAYTYVWADIVKDPTVWAQVQDVIRPESVDSSISMANRPARIRIRYRDDITADMRIIYGTRTLKITAAPAELGRREGLQIIAEDFSTEGSEP